MHLLFHKRSQTVYTNYPLCDWPPCCITTRSHELKSTTMCRQSNCKTLFPPDSHSWPPPRYNPISPPHTSQQFENGFLSAVKGNSIRILTGFSPPKVRCLLCVLSLLKNNSSCLPHKYWIRLNNSGTVVTLPPAHTFFLHGGMNILWGNHGKWHYF